MSLSPKKFTLAALVALVVPVIAVIGYNLYIDPFQIFHKDLEEPTVILGGRGTDRYQQAGIINQYDIESVIIGHSHAANYLPSKLRKELGWEKVYSLTMDGSPLYEHALVVRAALSKHAIKNVLWSFHLGNFIVPWDHINKKLPLKEYLYDESQLNDLHFFLTLDLHKYAKQKLKRKKDILTAENSKDLAEKEFDHATEWYSRNICGFNRPTFVAGKILRGKTLQYNKAATQIKLASVSQLDINKTDPEPNKIHKKYYDNMQQNVLPIIMENPKTRFNFVVTALPRLRMQWEKIYNPSKYFYRLQILKQFVLDMKSYDNVSIFGFDTELFPNDLRLYKDQGHYHPAVNNFIIEEIALQRNKLTAVNIDNYISNFDKKVVDYRLREEWDPSFEKEFPKSGYLSMEAASMLVQGKHSYSDVAITEKSLQDSPLPKCAIKIRKYRNKNQGDSHVLARPQHDT